MKRSLLKPSQHSQILNVYTYYVLILDYTVPPPAPSSRASAVSGGGSLPGEANNISASNLSQRLDLKDAAPTAPSLRLAHAVCAGANHIHF